MICLYQRVCNKYHWYVFTFFYCFYCVILRLLSIHFTMNASAMKINILVYGFLLYVQLKNYTVFYHFIRSTYRRFFTNKVWRNAFFLKQLWNIISSNAYIPACLRGDCQRQIEFIPTITRLCIVMKVKS